MCAAFVFSFARVCVCDVLCFMCVICIVHVINVRVALFCVVGLFVVICVCCFFVVLL